jgi:putative oligomerization/nucleic acid binding protein
MGLLKTGLKAAVAVKTADVIHERVLARQQEHAAAQGQPGQTAPVAQPPPVAPMPAAPAAAAPAPASPDMGEKLAQLKQLGELRAAGVLTDGEFEIQKAQILSA